MNGFLLDTHVWLWHLLGDSRLSEVTRNLIDTSLGDCWLSPVSIWETGVLRLHGKIRIHGSFRPWIEESRRKLPLRPAPLNEEVALASFELDLRHGDPADRFLAATAKVYGLKLITADGRLRKSASIETVVA